MVEILQSHTLALIQAGAYIAAGHCRLDQYPQVFEKQRKRLMTYRPKQGKSRYSDVYATFEASAEILQNMGQTGEDALSLLGILSMLGSSVLPLQLFEDAWAGSQDSLHGIQRESITFQILEKEHLPLLPGFIGVDNSEWDDFRLFEAVGQLESFSLITRQDFHKFPAISMHPLAHAVSIIKQEQRFSLDQSLHPLIFPEQGL